MKNILIVDDSALMRSVLSDIINKDEELHTEFSAKDGLEALKILEEHSIDAVVLDIIMPRMNGIEMLKEMKRRGYDQKVVIVSTIAKKGAGETIEALELGAFDFVTKPGSLFSVRSEEFAGLIRLLSCYRDILQCCFGWVSCWRGSWCRYRWMSNACVRPTLHCSSWGLRARCSEASACGSPFSWPPSASVSST